MWNELRHGIKSLLQTWVFSSSICPFVVLIIAAKMVFDWNVYVICAFCSFSVCVITTPVWKQKKTVDWFVLMGFKLALCWSGQLKKAYQMTMFNWKYHSFFFFQLISSMYRLHPCWGQRAIRICVHVSKCFSMLWLISLSSNLSAWTFQYIFRKIYTHTHSRVRTPYHNNRFYCVWCLQWLKRDNFLIIFI